MYKGRRCGNWASVLHYYRGVRLNNLHTPPYRHLLLLIFWPLFGMLFTLLERVLPLSFHEVYCPLDDVIPFCEYFVIPYYYWFVFMIGMLLYTLLFEVPVFRQYMRFIMISYCATVLIYLVYPTMQNLRPEIFLRENLCTAIVRLLYTFDTNTNVCPSIHVLGAVAACCAGLQCRRFRTVGWRLFLVFSAALICASTVFLKQHSVIDVVAALILCAIVYPIAFGWQKKTNRKKRRRLSNSKDGKEFPGGSPGRLKERTVNYDIYTL